MTAKAKKRRPARPVARAKGLSRKKKAARDWRGRLLRAFADAGFYLFAFAIALAALGVHFMRDLPSTDGLWRAEQGPRLVLIAADGSPIPVHGQSRGAPIRLADLPSHVPRAVLAVEDRNFYHHLGVNPVSVARAFIVNAREGAVRQGGSTLTQQLAKNLFLKPEKTYRRKVQELLLAFWLERRFSKEEILTLYLNRVYFGGGAYGVEAASRRYFGKPAGELTLAEAAILAGLLKAPSHYAPDRNPKDAGERGRLVVDAMVEAGFITRSEATAAYGARVKIAPSPFAGAPYFVDYAIAEAARKAKGVDADLTVRTTLDFRLQQAIENGVIAGVALEKLDQDIEVAAVILDREGRIRAMTGGRDYRASQFNRAADARRQPGSAFKPFVYLAAAEFGATPDDVIEDSPVRIGSWAPENYKSHYYGAVTLKEALARSLNAATIRLQEQTGRGAVRLAAKRMGFTTPLSQGPALALGVDAVSPLELGGAYAPFANGGYRIEPHAVERIDLSDGGRVYKKDGAYADVAASPHAILTANDMLAAVVAYGTGRGARLSRFVARGKTGTTQDYRDAWFAGHAGGLVCVVWVGRDDNKPMNEVTGGAAPATIWRQIMERALAGAPAETEKQAPPPIVAPALAAPDPAGQPDQAALSTP
jgi:penicillin-binding protein 1A